MYFPKLSISLILAMRRHFNCTLSSYMMIIFFTDPCTQNQIRLNHRIVQVCHNAQWGLVCDHEQSWNSRAAEVVCTQVGIPSRRQLVT